MSFEHNLMAHQVSARILNDIRSSQAPWLDSQLGQHTTLWQAMAVWPRPDIAFQDATNNVALAFEFKPPNQPKREYVTGLGQTLTYLNDFKFAGLILPEMANDGFQIAAYIRDLLSGLFSELPIALLSYRDDPAKFNVLRHLQARTNGPKSIPKGVGRKVFWGYWRDLSNHDLLTILGLMDSVHAIKFDKAFDRFWNRFATTGKAQTWEGSRRKRKSDAALGRAGEKLNIELAMKHAGLLASDGQMTEEGYALHHAGKVYGADSIAFLEKLAQQILTAGRHLDLIFWIEEQQRFVSTQKKRNAQEFYRGLDLRLAKAGIISAPPQNAPKQTFLRDEPKLWNKLGLLVRAGGVKYFHKKHGLVFNWRKIISVLEGS